jgi:hypothetical protein
MASVSRSLRVRLRARLTALIAAVAAAGVIGGGIAQATEIPSDMKIDWSSIAVSKDELLCLALNDYWEARSELIAGRIAVGRVVLNRVMDPRFPSNICDVIKQSKFAGTTNRCQFSWYCDQKTNDVPDSKEWRDSIKIAVALLQKDCSIPDPTGGALWYHADFLRPAWAAGFESTTIIGTHVFYREPDGPRTASAPRKPFIYRLNAFAEFVARRNARMQVAMARDAGSAVAMKDGTVIAQPLAR